MVESSFVALLEQSVLLLSTSYFLHHSRVRYTSVQTFSDQNTKTVSGYKEGPTGGAGSKPHKIEKVDNAVSGSCAGAGSEQFHIYRASRRREMDRIDNMEKDFLVDKEEKAFAGKIERNKRECDEKTQKNVEKRKKKKMKRDTARKMSSSDVKAVGDDGDAEGDVEENEDRDIVVSKAVPIDTMKVVMNTVVKA